MRLDISRPVFLRSARMGLVYVILSLAMGTFSAFGLNVGAVMGLGQNSGVSIADINSVLGLLVIPLGALAGLIITTPVYLLFVSDKNTGVLEYLLAVGMSQTDVFMGYLKASLLLSLIPITPIVLITLAFSAGGFLHAAAVSGLVLVTGLTDVSLVTVLMTAFSSLQRRPTGMNSPLGITIGVVFLFPELILTPVLKSEVFWVDVGVAAVLAGAVVLLFLSLEKLIKREKLLP